MGLPNNLKKLKEDISNNLENLLKEKEKKNKALGKISRND